MYYFMVRYFTSVTVCDLTFALAAAVVWMVC